MVMFALAKWLVCDQNEASQLFWLMECEQALWPNFKLHSPLIQHTTVPETVCNVTMCCISLMTVGPHISGSFLVLTLFLFLILIILIISMFILIISMYYVFMHLIWYLACDPLKLSNVYMWVIVTGFHPYQLWPVSVNQRLKDIACGSKVIQKF